MATPDDSSTWISNCSSRISREAVAKAADALLRWLRARDSKPQLLEHDDFLSLQLSLHRFPSHQSKSARVNPHLLALPHPLFSDHPSSLCLFFDDRSPSASASALLDRARSLSLPVDTAIGLSSLRSDYRPYEARRRLCDSHDLFFADRRILPLLPRLIGKEFFRKKKAPLPLDLSRCGWPLQLRRCLDSAFFRPSCKGTCAVVKVGRVSMTPEEIADNVMAAVAGAVEHVPKGWANLRSVLVKAADSVALPVYQAVPQMGLKIKVPASADVENGKDLKHDDEHEAGEVVDAKEVDEQFSGQKKKKKKNKGRIHEVIMSYMEMDETGEDAMDDDDDDNNEVHEDENGEEGTDEEVEKSATMKKRKKEGKTKRKTKGDKKKGNKDSNEENFDGRKQDDDDFEGEESDGLGLDRDLNKLKGKKKGKADKKMKEESDGEQGKRVGTTERRIKKTKKLEKVTKIKKKSKVRQT